MAAASNRAPLTADGSPAADRGRIAIDEQRMCQLAASFPSTASFGTSPWRPDELDAWGVAIWRDLSESLDPVFAEEAEALGMSSLPPIMVGLTTARFLLQLWDSSRSWQCGEMDLMQALQCIWDAPHRAAFLAWAEDPQWR